MNLVAAVVAAGLFWGLLGGEAHRKTERGNALYGQGDWTGAMSSYADAQGAAPEAPELHYDVGNVLYRQENWAGAAEAYGRALASAPPEIAGRAAFNLGNTHFKEGRFEEAAQAYRRALHAVPGDADAKRNLELALRALAQEKKPEDKKQPKENPKKDPEKKDPEKKDSEKKKDQGKQDQERQQEKGREPEPKPGSMSPEQARQLLGRLSDQEKDNVKREAMRRAQASPSRAPEKDW